MKDRFHRRNAAIASSLAAIVKPAAYFIILLLTYALGYLSSSPSTSASSSLSPPPLNSDITSTPPPYHYSTPDQSQLFQVTDTPPELNQFRIKTRCSPPIPHQQVRSTILQNVFNGQSPFIDFPQPHVAHLLHPKKIKGWGSNGAVFRNLVTQVKPRTIIEVGSFLGASATHMADLTRQLGLHTQILCVDDFRGWPGFLDRFKDLSMINGDVSLLYQFMQNVVSTNASDSIIPLPFSTGSVLDSLCEWGVYGDLIEVDAGHDFNSAWSDINRAHRILRPGGVLFGHDYFLSADNRGVRRAVNLFAQINGFKVKVDGQHWILVSP
ncbi:uncharacterized protein LOC101217115 [Cucumis sativus]|uniref:S-adenosyl-L-methionine-dependent methyltransferase n=1 Tax=Cucumis sativus TaxID=3659 RepID=A0A0A0KA15_CUCSA|nr:uncharacterized protein LOC101217115 [Cucumis sativus]KGN46540.1 hypothetical protein Csa_005120 [Cucumis sativus]